MSERAAYSRVYWSIIDDPKFEHVYDDDRALATWLRLLLVADQAWPASAHIPTGTHPKALAVLVGAGLVDVATGRRYRIHGLDAERTRRRDAATRPPGKRDPSGDQSGPNREPDSPYASGLRRERDETRRDQDETSSAPAQVDDQYNAPEFRAVQWLTGRGCYLPETSGYYRWLIRLLNLADDDIEVVIRAFGQLVRAGVKNGDVKGFLSGAEEIIRKKPDLKALEREERADEDRDRFNRGVESTRRLIAQMRGESV